jgi:putative alpha-1,2-mannosidase
MEYAANDFEIALLAKGLGKTPPITKIPRALRQLEEPLGPDFRRRIQGLHSPRHRDGSWLTPFTAMDELQLERKHLL